MGLKSLVYLGRAEEPCYHLIRNVDPMPHYSKAPITEALIDITVESAGTLSFEELRGVRARLREYPREEIRNRGEGVFQFGPSVQATARQQPWALVLRNHDNNQVAQVRLDGLTFSRLEPYQTWEQLRDEARRIWNIHRELLGPKKIVRVAVRYINRFNLPGDRVEPEEYLNLYPQVPQSLPGELRDYGPFLMSLRMPQPDLNGLLVMNEASTASTKPGTVAIVLDLELTVESPPVVDEQSLWSFFEKLRERKNLYFERCITDKTRELIR